MTLISCPSSGTDGLDDVLGSEFFSNRFFLVNGETGAGKIMFVCKSMIEGVRAGQQGKVRNYL